jgi:signal transduction histidine kinase
MSNAPPARPSAALALLPVPLCVVREGRVVLATPALHALLGLGEGEGLEGRALREVVRAHLSDADVTRTRPSRRALLSAPGGTPVWVELRDGAGRLRTVRVRSSAGPGEGEVVLVADAADAEGATARLATALAEASARMPGLREEAEVLACAVDAVHAQGLHAIVLHARGDRLVLGAVRQPPAFHAAAREFFGVPMEQADMPLSALPALVGLMEGRRGRFFPDLQALAALVFGEGAREALDAAGLPREPAAVAPVLVEGAPYGFLAVQGASLTPAAAATLELFAQGLGVALGNVRHHRRAREQLERVQRLQAELVREARLTVLGEAAGVVAHEVRNPLAVLLNAVALLRRDRGLSPLSAQMVDTVEEEARRLDTVVRDLLEVTRPLELKRAPVDLAALVRRTLEALPGAAPAVAVDADPATPAVEVDGHLLQEALACLLRNAVEASPAGERVHVAVARHGTGAALVVEDRGPGVPPQDRDRIFEPFFTTRARGTGLGLTLVRRVADAHGAQVRVEGREGGGARFTLLLPRA